MIDDGRGALDHAGRLILTGLGTGGLVGVTTAAVVTLAGGESGSGYLQGYLLAGVGVGVAIGTLAGAGVAAVVLAGVRRRPRSGRDLEPVTVFATVAVVEPVVLIVCLWLDASAAATVVAAVLGGVEAVLALRITHRWRWAALGR